jgi:hypothetical protein
MRASKAACRLELDHGVERQAFGLQHHVKCLGLSNRAREAVEDKAPARLALANALGDDPTTTSSGTSAPEAMMSRARRPTAYPLPRRHAAGLRRKLRDPVLGDEPRRLRALPARRAEKN